MSRFLDPWNDAQKIEQRLRQPNAKLIVVVGAEAWCEKCRQFRPVVEQRADQAIERETWLWLDLEEHAEFLQGYLPEDLPQLLIYEAQKLTHQQTVLPTAADLEAALSAPLANKPASDPGILATLTRRDWAS